MLLALIEFLTIVSCQKDEVGYNQDLHYDTFTDSRDGRIYKTIEIGNQIWMAENLKYNDFEEMTYCNYGRMYTISSNRDYCPKGWHIPDSAEFMELINFLGGAEIAGSKMKEVGNDHWKNPNTDATNSSGFTALPAGFADDTYGLQAREESAQFWTSTEKKDPDYYCGNSYYYISLHYKSSKVTFFHSSDECDFFEQRSVRCVKNK